MENRGSVERSITCDPLQRSRLAGASDRFAGDFFCGSGRWTLHVRVLLLSGALHIVYVYSPVTKHMPLSPTQEWS